ncbi:DUF4126 domain-containing protein [Desulfobulbus elongatus]|uniref:DUF4126 domain-containing protein n=1 Tax=Desulfobulbus elongatus TaxID=53332 RepID=UPI0005584421|nr:DUF4126 domain-containing protein [Desulfobulbus elongatus]
MATADPITGTLALATGLAWASGINLYAALLVVGLLAANGAIPLPPDLQVLAHPWVIGAAATMYLAEFLADKVPGVDSVWDSLHTLIRIPAGAVLAAGAIGEVDPAVTAVAALVGGTVSAGAHALKAGTRILVNASPEPFSNWALSIGEDAAVLAGLWIAVTHPWLFLVCLGLFVLACLCLLPLLWRGIRHLVRRLTGLFGPAARPPSL